MDDKDTSIDEISDVLDKDALIDEILNIELDMFLSVPAVNKECQESPGSFKLVRRSALETWAASTLRSYLGDLTEASREDRNLMTEKYARIDGHIPFMSINPVLDKIIKIIIGFRSELTQKYPRLLSSQVDSGYTYGVPNFEIYLRAELETYSNETLDFYFQDVSEALADGRSILEETYSRMFQKLGYQSIEEAERLSPGQ